MLTMVARVLLLPIRLFAAQQELEVYLPTGILLPAHWTNMASSFVTPAPRSARSKIVQATPAFDPRLPKTPFLRQPRRGERYQYRLLSELTLSQYHVNEWLAIGHGCNKHSWQHQAKYYHSTSRQRQGRLFFCDSELMVSQAIELSTDMDLSEVTSNLNKRSRKDAVNKLQDLQSQIQDLMAQLA